MAGQPHRTFYSAGPFLSHAVLCVGTGHMTIKHLQ